VAVSSKKLNQCHQLLSEEWKSTKAIMMQLNVSRGHTIKTLNALRKNGLAKKKQPPHSFNTCNKKDALWMLN
jgi:predicted transcriptional regulator